MLFVDFLSLSCQYYRAKYSLVQLHTQRALNRETGSGEFLNTLWFVRKTE